MIQDEFEQVDKLVEKGRSKRNKSQRDLGPKKTVILSSSKIGVNN